MKIKKYFALLILWIVYFFMLAICISLSISTYRTLEPGAAFQSITINLVMFLIVGLAFIYCTVKLIRVISIAVEVGSATKKIKYDFENGEPLWEKYSTYSDELFHIKGLKEKYNEFVLESKRFAELTKGSYKCKIDDFINEDYLNSTMNKTLCNLVPGLMTGLGILGTFIGLSLGLQSFNTGSAAEISDSITPLMGGIKIAFHTSVYGMVFSLAFNWIYKYISESAMVNLNEFLSVYDGHVMLDSAYTNESEIHNLIRQLPDEFGKQMNETLAPAMSGISNMFKSYADNVSENQMKGLSNIVDSFVESMNASLGDNFTRLGEVLDKTCEMQEKNNEQVMGLIEKIGLMATDIDRINELSNNTVEKLSDYIDKINNYQGEINKFQEALNAHEEKQNEINTLMTNNIKELNEQENVIVDITKQVLKNLEEQIVDLSKLGKDLSLEAKENMEQLAAQAYDYNEQIAEFAREQLEKMSQYSENQTVSMKDAATELSKIIVSLDNKLGESLTETFKCFDSNLSEISDHLSGTISEVDETTKRVPSVVNAAYAGMERSLDDIQSKMDTFVEMLNEDIKRRQMMLQMMHQTDGTNIKG